MRCLWTTECRLVDHGGASLDINSSLFFLLLCAFGLWRWGVWGGLLWDSWPCRRLCRTLMSGLNTLPSPCRVVSTTGTYTDTYTGLLPVPPAASGWGEEQGGWGDWGLGLSAVGRLVWMALCLFVIISPPPLASATHTPLPPSPAPPRSILSATHHRCCIQTSAIKGPSNLKPRSRSLSPSLSLSHSLCPHETCIYSNGDGQKVANEI